MRLLVSVRTAAIGALLGLLVIGLLPPTALAHERRDVGKYSFAVGFNGEPAYQGQPNAALITVTVPSEDARPVEGLADALKATIAFGGGPPKEFKLRAVFGRPGAYVADFIPTRAGAYIFNFSGAIEGTPVNERFESGPGRFNNVESVEAIQFPEAIPPGNDVARIARAADDRATAAWVCWHLSSPSSPLVWQ
ncbi:MAG: hypothetical protein HW416_3414 [Chloroflexi bacterium]|nr:hypothetical protein [Chloroflexota bacterium]